ncbi:G-protein coupled receptor 37-like 1 [Syngnathoides biaculeatus]|uniref:G-protein coupled receptor 37-like 1 n=1 Tax=Syngnathoides biaculeatus TaxID=300417 RepID=UPI002ADD4095|nr:G-protein coupled receptor 37-like 1 [Syngnathoides biaculeatus]
MSALFLTLLVFVGSAELRTNVRPPPSTGAAHLGRGEQAAAVPRGLFPGSSLDEARRRREDPSGYFTTPRVTKGTTALGANSPSSPGPPRPLLPVSGGSYWAYALLLLALALFSVGMVGNLALMCTVWHNVYLQSTWNCILAGLALLDFLVLFFCLPVVVFHELTSRRLLGGASCRLVPYLEVTSLGVATFSLCALSIDRFHAATSPAPGPGPESCRSILSKMAVVWLGSLTLAAPELLLWQLRREPVGPGGSASAGLRMWTDAPAADVCAREPAAELPDGVYSLVLTYRDARTWWMFGCYVCLPLLFALACDLATRRVSAQRPVKAASRCSSSSSASSCASSSPTKRNKHGRRHGDPRLGSTVMWLTSLYVACNLPDSACSIALAYAAEPAAAAAAATVAGHFFLFARCAAAPVLLLCSCRSLGQAFLDCCCCCCDECLPDAASSADASSTAAASALSSPSPTSLTALRAVGTPC